MTRSQPPVTPIERDVVEAEASVVDFAGKQKRVDVTVLRCANVLGPDVQTSFAQMLSLPLVPMIAGFDPRLQFVHEDDIVHALEHAAVNRIPGVFNVAADGVLALSEIVGLLGKRPLPVLPPWGAGLLSRAAARPPGPDPAGDAEDAPLRPRHRQPPLQGERVRIRLHDAGGGRSPSPSTCGSSRSSAASSPPTPMRARSSVSCAAARWPARRSRRRRGERHRAQEPFGI